MSTYRVVAFNPAKASENRIHDDSVARQHGFRGGLVPGVTLWAYLTRPVVERWGRAFLERGTMEARFVHPVYEGELAIVDALGDDEQVELTITGEDGGLRATGRASLPDPAVAPAADEWPVVPLPTTRRPPTPEALAADPLLGTVEATFRAEHAPVFLDQVADDLPLYRHEGVAHPGWLMTFANTVLVANVALGPWIHVASQAAHYGPVRDGERVATRGRIVDLFERKGHRFVQLDLLLVADGRRPVLHVDHTAIYELAKKSPNP